MSSIKTTHIDGDISIGRNVSIGGKTTVQGNSLFKGNVRVAGWFEAKNIKYANKGLFETLDKLEQNYPAPRNGWWAIVGNTLPGALYIAYDEKWINTGNTAGEVTIDCDIFNERLESIQGYISEIQAWIEECRVRDEELEGKVRELAEGGSDVVEFLGIDDFVDSVQDKTDKSADDEGCAVVYNPTHSAFFLRILTGFTALYYKSWNGSAQWNRWLESAGGYRPRANKLYVSSEGILYWWNSLELLATVGGFGGGNEEITEALSAMSIDIQNLYKANEECGERDEKLSKEIQEVSKELEGEKQTRAENIETLQDTFRNLATINGHSLLDGGDIVIVGDGIIEAIPDEFIEQLGNEE